MNIGIAINGEGRGHFSRAIALTEILGQKYHVEFWVPEHLQDELRNRFPDFPVHTIPYLKFVQKGFTLSYRRTMLENKQTILNAFRVSSRISVELTERNISALISDFEPFCSRGAKLAGIPVLQLNHPGVVRKRPALTFPGIVSQLVACYMMHGADRTMICSFFDGDIGPIIRHELRAKKLSVGNHIVVYQKKQYEKILAPVLEMYRKMGYEFRVFPNKDMDYAAELASCRAVICPAGHQSLSEALALHKPVFAIPVEGQYEQELNAHRLKSSGFGTYAFASKMESRLGEFLSNIEDYRRKMEEYSALSYEQKKKMRWNCEDSTFKAVELIENFINDIPHRPEWTEVPVLDALRWEFEIKRRTSA